LPAFVTGANTPESVVTALRAAFAAASRQEWFGAIADELLLDGFAPVTSADYARTLEWDREAKLAGYPLPA
jgi:ABC-type phosphate/phosphonate transport system substrate-binding protein